MLLYHFYFIFILFVHAGHTNFDLINFQYLQNVVFSFEKGWGSQNHSLSDSHHLIEKFPQPNFPSLLPLNVTWKTLDKAPSLLKFICLFQLKFNFSIENIFFQSSIITSKIRLSINWTVIESLKIIWNSCASF